MRILRFFRRRAVLFALNLFSGPPEQDWCQKISRALLGVLGASVGPKCQISESLYVYDGSKLRLGPGCRLGSFTRIWDFAPVTIGENLLSSHNLTIIAGTHDSTTLANRPGPVRIGRNVWIGANVTIVGPVTIGDDVILGAGAVVLKDIPARVVAGGLPARVLKLRVVPPVAETLSADQRTITATPKREASRR